MRPPRSALRTTLAVVTALVLASGTAVLLPAPAQADSLVGQAEVIAGSSSTGGTCTGTDEDTKQVNFLASATRKSSVSLDGLVTDGGDAGDVTSWAARASMKVTSRSGGSNPSLALTGKVLASVDADQGDASGCAVQSSTVVTGIGLMKLDSSGWLTMSLAHPAGTTGVVVVTDEQTMQIIYQDSGQESFHGSVWTGAGTYLVQTVVQGTADDDSTTTAPPTVSGRVGASVAYLPAGASRAKASGPGKAYVALGDSVNCTDRQVLGVFTKKANAVRSATFLVNGKKQRTVGDPSAGEAVVLKTGSATSATTVKVVLQTPTKKVTVSRSYLACE